MSKNKGKAIGITILAIIVPMFVTHVLFKINLGCYYVAAEWDAGDMLGYFGDVLSFLGTVVLGYVAIGGNFVISISRRLETIRVEMLDTEQK